MTTKRMHVAFGSVLVAITLACASVASAQPERQRLRDINQQAMTAYGGLELETAKSLLEQALQVAARANITSGRELAQTYLNLGVVSIGGFGDNPTGLGHFVNALRADPTITLDPNTSTPDVQAMFAQARARAASGTTTTPPVADTGATLLHDAVEEQLEDHPIPVFVQVPPSFRAVEVILRYRAGGTGMFASLVMDRVGNGYGMEIPCAAIHAASVQYFIIARDAQQRVVARVGSETQPVNVRIVARRTRPTPALPTRSPPEACPSGATPPRQGAATPAATPEPSTTSAEPATTEPTTDTSEPELRSTGTGIVGDACEETAQCSGDLECVGGQCVATTVIAEGEAPRFFFNMGYSAGWVGVRPGMQTDSSVPFDPRNKPEGWNDAINGPYAPPGYTEAEWLTVVSLLYPSYVLPADGVAPSNGDVRQLDPDCDVGANGYCVRVSQKGVRPVGALRFELGYWIIPRVGVSVDIRTSTHAGRGTLARSLFALRAHVLVTPPRAVGANVSLYLGGGIGQIQGRVPQGRYEGPDIANPSTGLVYLQSGTRVHEPWVESGLGHVQAGGAFGYRFTERIGIVVEPTLYLLFPAFAVAADTTISVGLTF